MLYYSKINEGDRNMKLGKTHSGLITSHKSKIKNIKGVEDEKIQKRVVEVKVQTEFTAGDLSEFIPGNVQDDFLFNSASWDEEIIGTYSVNINDIEFNSKIIKIQRKNSDKGTFSTITFESEDVDQTANLVHYFKDKDNPIQIKISKIEE